MQREYALRYNHTNIYICVWEQIALRIKIEIVLFIKCKQKHDRVYGHTQIHAHLSMMVQSTHTPIFAHTLSNLKHQYHWMRTVHKLLDIMNQKKLYSFIRARQSYLWLYENFVCVSLCLVSLCAQLNAKKTQKKRRSSWVES